MTDRIIWESAADLNTRLRVVRLADAGEGHEALLVERGEKDSQGVRAWLETDDPDDRAEATCLALCKLDDTLQAKGPDPKREALSPEVKAPGFYPLRPELEIASLRAEFAALGKHVEDVERRAYASPTNDALTVELGHNVNAPSWQIITTGWQGAVDRLAAKVDALERAHLARATSHDLTGDAVTRLVSKVDELDGFCSGLRSRCGAIEQEARQHMRHATELADVQTAALAALGDRVAELNDASDTAEGRCS